MNAGMEMVSWRTVKDSYESFAHFWLQVEQKGTDETE